ncbi:YtpR family tRNA-binding protein [Helicobacter suis]|uniref:YtpR family tRNA-binding protein n=1 Tax=Helicobacter suis TaxID=104628 RepID=UPI001F343A3A|nr:phenylalanine--tRNA ligase subunit beta [Helicobacter suis]
MLLHTAHLDYFLDTKTLDILQLSEDLARVGLEVESICRFNWPQVVVAKVLTKEKHPNAEKLSLCQVDSGSQVLEIVCGAHNVEAGQFVALALEGAYLPAINTHIKPSIIRGVESFGMICSAKELGLPSIYEGIFILDDSLHKSPLIPGIALDQLDFFQGALLDIAITPNRGDCLSVLGLAKEIAALYSLKLTLPKIPPLQNPLSLNLPQDLPLVLGYASFKLEKSHLPLEILLTLALQNNLQKNPLSNLLEYTTYLSGVIMHAYPAHISLNIQKDSLGFVRVFDAYKELSNIAISSPQTQDLDCLLEASFLDPNYIATRLHAHNLKHNALTQRTTRGSNPDVGLAFGILQTLLKRFNIPFSLHLRFLSPPLNPKTLEISAVKIAKILGLRLSSKKIQNVLESLGFKVQSQNSSLIVQIPLDRHDITLEEDIAEEVLRFIGLDKIPSTPLLLFEKEINNPHYTRFLFERQLAYKALALQFNEVVHYLFTKKENLEKLGYPTLQEHLDLLNPISSDLNTLRTSLIPGLLEASKRNKNLGFKSIALFELGSVYNAQREEGQSLAFLACGLQITPHYPNPKGTPWDFYSFARTLSQIIGPFDLKPLSTKEYQDHPFLNTTYHPHQSARIFKDGCSLGFLGAIHPAIIQQEDLLEGFIAEINSALLVAKAYQAEAFSKLPTSLRDLTVIVAKDCIFAEIKDKLLKANIAHLQEVFPLDIYPENAHEIALSLRLKIQSQEALNDVAIEEVVRHTLRVLEQHFQAKLK